MSRDGLLPKFFSKVHPKFRTPYIGTIITGTFVATFAAFANIAEVVDLTNIGTLFAFVLVSAGVIFLRSDRSGSSAPVPRAVGTDHAAHLDRGVHLPDAPVADDHLDPVRHLVVVRPGDLLPVRLQELRAPEEAGGLARGEGRQPSRHLSFLHDLSSHPSSETNGEHRKRVHGTTGSPHGAAPHNGDAVDPDLDGPWHRHRVLLPRGRSAHSTVGGPRPTSRSCRRSSCG